MPPTVEHVQTDKRFAELLEALLEYERDVDPDLRHGAEPTLAEVQRNYQSPNAAFLALVDNQVGDVLYRLRWMSRRPCSSGSVQGHRFAAMVSDGRSSKPSSRTRATAGCGASYSIRTGNDCRRRTASTFPSALRRVKQFASVDYRCPTFLERTLSR